MLKYIITNCEESVIAELLTDLTSTNHIFNDYKMSDEFEELFKCTDECFGSTHRAQAVIQSPEELKIIQELELELKNTESKFMSGQINLNSSPLLNNPELNTQPIDMDQIIEYDPIPEEYPMGCESTSTVQSQTNLVSMVSTLNINSPSDLSQLSGQFSPQSITSPQSESYSPLYSPVTPHMDQNQFASSAMLSPSQPIQYRSNTSTGMALSLPETWTGYIPEDLIQIGGPELTVPSVRPSHRQVMPYQRNQTAPALPTFVDAFKPNLQLNSVCNSLLPSMSSSGETRSSCAVNDNRVECTQSQTQTYQQYCSACALQCRPRSVSAPVLSESIPPQNRGPGRPLSAGPKKTMGVRDKRERDDRILRETDLKNHQLRYKVNAILSARQDYFYKLKMIMGEDNFCRIYNENRHKFST